MMEHDGNRTSATLAERVRSLQLPGSNTHRARDGISWLPWLLCLLLAGTSGYLLYRVFIDKDQQVASKAETQRLQAAAADPKGNVPDAPGGVALEAGGYVIPVHRVTVSPKVGGQVVELFIEEGQHVQKDQLIARLDPTEYEFEYNRMKALTELAKARLDEQQRGNREEEKKQSEATLREAQALRSQLQDEVNRLKKSGVAAAEEDLVRVESKCHQADLRVEQLQQLNKMMQDGPRKERIEAARAEYDHAEAQRKKAKYFLDNCKVLAPVDGTILEKRAEVGNTVRPEAFSNGLSASLCDMADLTQLEVDVDISERDLNKVAKEQVCKIRTEAFPDVVYDGRVSRIMPVANRSKASVSVRVKIEVPANDMVLRPDMRARVHFLAAEKEKSAEKAKSNTR